MKWTKDVTKTRLANASESASSQKYENRRQHELNGTGKKGQKNPQKASKNSPRQNIEPSPRLPQLGQQQQRMQDRTDDIRRQTRLIPLHHLKLACQNPRILHHNIQPLQAHRALSEKPDRLIVREVELPDLDDARAAGRLLNGPLGRLALFDGPDGEDDFGGVEADEVAGGFEAEAGVAAGHDDGLVGVLFGGVGGRDEELGAHEREGFLHVGHLGDLAQTFIDDMFT